jgi:hypothetical protein
MSLAIPFLRAGSPIITDKEQNDYWQEQLGKRERKEAVDGFGSAIRAKPQWYFKILQQKELADKWVKEAQIEAGDDLNSLIRYVEHVFWMREVFRSLIYVW